MTVNVYTITSAKSPKVHDARIIYTLETMTSKGPADVTREERVEATANEAALLAIVKALEHITMPCELHIYTESRWVASGFGWKKKTGRPRRERMWRIKRHGSSWIRC